VMALQENISPMAERNPEFVEFRIIVRSKKDTILIIRNSEILNDRPYYGKVDLNPLTEDTINIFYDWLIEDKIKKSKELVIFGAILYRVLFNYDIDQKFRDI
jgi:hypothetical protein